jgi:hypothetical protein
MNRFFRNLYRHVAVFFILFSLICCYGLYLPLSANCENSIAEELISLNIENQPLGEVLEDISAETGYQFNIDESWNDFPVTASMKNEPLHRGLKRILRNLNNAVIYGSDGTIRIKIYEQEKSSGYPAGHSMVNRSYEEPIRQPVIPGDRPPLNSGAQLLKRKRLAYTGEQTSEENSESDPESDETDDETEETEEPSGTADKEEAVDSESNPAENASEEDEGQAAETDVTSENTPDSEAKESD